MPSGEAHSSLGQGAGRLAPKPTIAPRGPSSAVAGVDPKDLLIASDGINTSFIDSNSGKVIAAVGGRYEGTEINNPVRVILFGRSPEMNGKFTYGEYDISNGESRWLLPPSNGSYQQLFPELIISPEQLSPDRSKGIFFVNRDAWIVDLDWQNFQIRNPRQATQIGAFEPFYSADHIRWASNNIVFVDSLRIDLSTVRITEPFKAATFLSLFSPDSKYAIGQLSGQTGVYAYDAVNDIWVSLPGWLKKRYLDDSYSWTSNTEFIAKQYDSTENANHFWLIDATKPVKRRDLLGMQGQSVNAKIYGDYLSVGLSAALFDHKITIVNIKSGRRLDMPDEPILFLPLCASQFILISRSGDSLEERGTWLINFATGSMQRLTPYIAQQAVALERKNLVFFAANGDLWRAGFDGKGLVKLGSAPPGVLQAPKPIKLP